jgi:hypothetical protein
MVRRIAAAFGFVILASVTPVLAAQPADADAQAAANESRVAAPLFVDLDWSARIAMSAPVSEKRPSILPGLYVSLAGLNAYDAFSTLRGVSNGAKEANGAMQGVAHTPTAMWAVKGGITAGSILAAEHLWKSGHRAHAVALMVASNGMMVAVAAHNTGVTVAQK